MISRLLYLLCGYLTPLFHVQTASSRKNSFPIFIFPVPFFCSEFFGLSSRIYYVFFFKFILNLGNVLNVQLSPLYLNCFYIM